MRSSRNPLFQSALNLFRQNLGSKTSSLTSHIPSPLALTSKRSFWIHASTVGKLRFNLGVAQHKLDINQSEGEKLRKEIQILKENIAHEEAIDKLLQTMIGNPKLDYEIFFSNMNDSQLERAMDIACQKQALDAIQYLALTKKVSLRNPIIYCINRLHEKAALLLIGILKKEDLDYSYQSADGSDTESLLIIAMNKFLKLPETDIAGKTILKNIMLQMLRAGADIHMTYGTYGGRSLSALQVAKKSGVKGFEELLLANAVKEEPKRTFSF